MSGSTASLWTWAPTSFSTHSQPKLPDYLIGLPLFPGVATQLGIGIQRSMSSSPGNGPVRADQLPWWSVPSSPGNGLARAVLVPRCCVHPSCNVWGFHGLCAFFCWHGMDVLLPKAEQFRYLVSEIILIQTFSQCTSCGNNLYSTPSRPHYNYFDLIYVFFFSVYHLN